MMESRVIIQRPALVEPYLGTARHAINQTKIISWREAIITGTLSVTYKIGRTAGLSGAIDEGERFVAVRNAL